MARMFAIERFMTKVRKETQGELGHVVIINQYPWSSRPDKWPEMSDPDFRAKILAECARRSSPVVCARFSGPDGYSDDWSFSAYRRPKKIQAGHCIVCNHAYIQNGHCQNTSCQSSQEQTYKVWLSTPESRRSERERHKGDWLFRWIGI